MLCRCKSCVVKEEEEEDDAKVFRKSPSTKQNKGAKDTFLPSKNSKFLPTDFGVVCVR
jgi:hypothetical protein